MDRFARRRQAVFAPHEPRFLELHGRSPELERNDWLSLTLEGALDNWIGSVIELGRRVGLELTLRSLEDDCRSPGPDADLSHVPSSDERVAAIVRTLTAHRTARGIQKQVFAQVIGRTAHCITRFDSGRLRYNLNFVLEYASLLDLELVFVDPTAETTAMPGIDGLSPDMPFNPPPVHHIDPGRRRVSRKSRKKSRGSDTLASSEEMLVRRGEFFMSVRNHLSRLAEDARHALTAMLPRGTVEMAFSGKDSFLADSCALLSMTGHVPTWVPSDAVVVGHPVRNLRPAAESDHGRRGREMALEIVGRLDEFRRMAGCAKEDLRRLAGLRFQVSECVDGPLPRLSSVMRIADVFDLKIVALPADDPRAGRTQIAGISLRNSRLHAPYKLLHLREDAVKSSKLEAERAAVLERIAAKKAVRAEDVAARQAETERLEAFRRRRREWRASLSTAELAEHDRRKRERTNRRHALKRFDPTASTGPTLRTEGAVPPCRASDPTLDKTTLEALRALRQQLGDAGREIRGNQPRFADFLAATTRTGHSIVLRTGDRAKTLRTRRPAAEFYAEWTTFLGKKLKLSDVSEDSTRSLVDEVCNLSSAVPLNHVLYCLGRSGIALHLT